MGKGSGFGKVILFGEHFVVYGVPGIVSAIDSTVDAKVERIGTGIIVHDERKGTLGYTEKKRAEQRESLERILRTMKINPEKTVLEVWLGGNLPSYSGIGASAASSVAISRSIAEEFSLKLSDEEINEIAYEAEKAYAGNPSGIDNTAATYGGLLWFKKNVTGGQNTIERLNIRQPVEIVISNTGIVADTKEMVRRVACRKQAKDVKYSLLFKQAADLAFKMRIALENFNLREVGKLMNENHRLLQEIEVSCEELDYLVDLAREQGALGAKLTGGGGGGCILALTPGKKLQNAVAESIKKQGFEFLTPTIGIQKAIETNSLD